MAFWGLRVAKVYFSAALMLFAITSSTMAATPALPRQKPPAPGPQYLSSADYIKLKSIKADLKARRFSAAQRQTSEINDPIARSLGQWLYFSAEDPSVDLNSADTFLDLHDNWPAISRIQTHIEKRITNSTPATDVRAFFDSRDPVSGDGKIQLARALFDQGDNTAALAQLRDAWVNNNFSASKEKRILKSFGKHLTKDDHKARVDRMLFSRQVTNARRTIPLLTDSEKRKANARAAFILNASSAPRLYKELSRDHQLDSGVLHAAVRYYRRKGDNQYAQSLSEEAPKNAEALRNPDRWWYERQLLMRNALKEGRFADAYRVAANHGFDDGGEIASAEFNAGWIALRFLNRPEQAEAHFKALATAVRTPISLSRAYYWLGRAAKASGDTSLADEYFTKAAPHYYSYYGQLAAEELGGYAAQQRFMEFAPASPTDRALFTSRPTAAALRMLSELDLDFEFMVFAYHIDGDLDRPGEYLELAELTNGEGAPHLTVRAGKVSVQRDAFAPHVSYPVVFIPDEATNYVAPEIILGLSRQESEFNPRAYSRAGARGMMQLLPSTAQLTAKKEGIRYSRSALLDDPIYNMTIGSAHLSHLLNRFDGSLVMTFAGYNAGPHRVDRWVEAYGDPRTPDVDPVDWVELIPFEETRNYVQRVLENIQVYRGRLNAAPIPGQLSADLERGGTGQRAAKLDSPSKRLAKLSAPYAGQQIAAPSATTKQRVEKFDRETTIGQPQLVAPSTPDTPDALTISNENSRKVSDTVTNAVSTEDITRNQETPVTAKTDTSFSLSDDTVIPASTQNDTFPLDDAAVADEKITAIVPDENTVPDSNDALINAIVSAGTEETPVLVEPSAVTILDPVVDASSGNNATPAIVGPLQELPAGSPLNDTEYCESYRAYLARNAEGDTTAAELNSNALEGLRSDAGACG